MFDHVNKSAISPHDITNVNMCGLALYFILETGVGGSHGEHFKIARPSGEIWDNLRKRAWSVLALKWSNILYKSDIVPDRWESGVIAWRYSSPKNNYCVITLMLLRTLNISHTNYILKNVDNQTVSVPTDCIAFLLVTLVSVNDPFEICQTAKQAL